LEGVGGGVHVNAQLLEVSLLAPVRWPDVHACMPREGERARAKERERERARERARERKREKGQCRPRRV
jgi:hypothetical protein